MDNFVYSMGQLVEAAVAYNVERRKDFSRDRETIFIWRHFFAKSDRRFLKREIMTTDRGWVEVLPGNMAPDDLPYIDGMDMMDREAASRGLDRMLDELLKLLSVDINQAQATREELLARADELLRRTGPEDGGGSSASRHRNSSLGS